MSGVGGSFGGRHDRVRTARRMIVLKERPLPDELFHVQFKKSLQNSC